MKNFYNLRIGIFLLLSLIAISYSAHSQTSITWNGGGTTNNWSDGDNWNGGVVPDPGDNAVFQDFDATVTFITSPSVDILDIRAGRFVSLDLGGNTLSLGAPGKSNIVKVGSSSTLEVSGGTLDVIADSNRDAFQFRGGGGLFEVAGATINITGQRGIWAKSDANSGEIINDGEIYISGVSNDDAIFFNDKELTLFNDECAIIDLDGGLIKDASPSSSLTNDGLIIGGGITVDNATNNAFYDFGGADFSTGNNVTDNGVDVNDVVDANGSCIIDLTPNATGGMIEFNWDTGTSNGDDGILDISGAGFPASGGTISVSGCLDVSIDVININDADCDGVITSEDCDDNDPNITSSSANDADCDGVITSEDCDDNDPTNTNSNVNDADCDGVITAEDCDDNDPTNTNSNVNDADCDGVITSEDCDDNDPTNTNSNVNDADCDGVITLEDCDDNDPTNTNSNVNDADCDGVITSEDCDDNDPTNTNSNVNDADCDGVITAEDCDDNDPTNTNSNVNDADCDGVITSEDCDDNDPTNTNSNVNDADCDGVITADDCDDSDPLITTIPGDPCDDGNPDTSNDIVLADCTCLGEYDCPTLMLNIGDPCDDGDAATGNDTVQTDCSCSGQLLFDCPTLMLDIGDPCDDGDSATNNDVILADCTCMGEFDCPTLELNIGDSCNDGNSDTSNDTVQPDCSCAGQLTFDCPTLMLDIGDPCDDGNSETSNDTVQADCTCAGEFDCPTLMLNIGDPCDDGDPATGNDMIQADCTCAGQLTFDCPALMLDIGDPCDDGNPETSNDTVQQDCTCAGEFDCPTLMLNIGDPCDDGDPATGNDMIQADCSCAGQLTFDCPTLMLDIGDPCDDNDPETSNDTVQADCTCAGVFDCPTLMLNIGDPCDDGDPATGNDVIQSDCSCAGQLTFDCPVLMLDIGDSCDDGNAETSNDTVQADCTCLGEFDCPTLMLNIGDPCDDGDPATGNDMIQADCSCAGQLTFDCPALMLDIGDSCDDDNTETNNDTVQADCTCLGVFDCPTLMLNIGDPCDDGDPATGNDMIQADCSCAGQLTFDCPALMLDIGDVCDDGNAETSNDTVQADCTCLGEFDCSILSMNINVSNIEIQNTTCFGTPTGAFAIEVNGGVGDYVIEVDGQVFDGTEATSLNSGEYQVIISDSNGCSITESVSIGEAPQVELELTSQLDPICSGDASGEISVTASGGTGAFTYTTSGSTNTSGIFENLSANSYTIEVMDDNGCSASQVVNLIDPPTIVVAEVITTNTLCPDSADGSAMLIANGGAGELQYSIDGGPPQLGSSFSGLGVNQYTVFVTDENGCEVTSEFAIDSASQVDTQAVTITLVDQEQGTLGGLVVDAIGGMEPYTYSINGVDYQSSNQFEGLNAGDLTLSILDANECLMSFDINVGTSAVCGGAFQDQVIDFIIAPNPINNHLNMTFCSSSTQEVVYTIYDESGRLILKSTRLYPSGSNSDRLDVSSFPEGIFIIGVTSLSRTNHYRFVKID